MSRIELGRREIRRLNWLGLKPVVARVLGSRVVNPLVQAAARVIPARIATRLPLNQRSATYRLDNGRTVELLDPLHDTVARDIHWGGGKPASPVERHKLSCFERLSERSATVLDIGAYGGLYALIGARANERLRAIAFEIVPENFLLLVRNVIANDLVDRVQPRLCGIGAAQAKLTMPREFGAASYLSSISLGSKFESGVSVPVATLDEEVRNIEGPVLIKIDVEGFEDEVFRGGTGFMERHRPDIICEILPGAFESCGLITELLVPLGYRWLCFEDSGPVSYDRLEPHVVMRDWLFTADAALARSLVEPGG